MYKLLIGLMLVSAAQQLDLGAAISTYDTNRSSLVKIEKASLRILRIDWRPISVFPNEAKRFQ